MPTEREVFRRLFINRGPMRPTEFAREIITSGLVAYYKWDEAFSRETGNPGRVVPPEELERFQLTDQRVHDIENLVTSALREYTDGGRRIPGFWYGVWQSAVGAFVYSLLVAAVVLALVFGNVNVPTLLGIEIKSTPAYPTGDGGRETDR